MFVKPCVHDVRIRFEIPDKERIDQSHWSIDRIIQMRVVNSFFVRDLGTISSILDPRSFLKENKTNIINIFYIILTLFVNNRCYYLLCFLLNVHNYYKSNKFKNFEIFSLIFQKLLIKYFD